jgi:hypothetical protein
VEERGQLADSLVEIAIFGDESASFSALGALAVAGRIGAEGRYEGAKDRLLAIIRRTEAPLRQLNAFAAFLTMPGAAAEFDLITGFVRQPDPIGALAFQEVERLGDPDSEFYSKSGEATLRRVIRGGGFQSEIVKKRAAAIARERGWRFGL